MNIVVSYRGIANARGWEAGACLARAFRQLGHSVYDYGNVYGTRERLTPTPPPATIDLWVYVECGDDEPQYAEMNWYQPKRKVFWEWDTHLHPGFSFNLMRQMRFDYVFLANKDYVAIVQSFQRQAGYLPFALADDIFRRMPEVPKTIDVGTIARAALDERRKPIERLQQLGINAQLITGVYGEAMIRTLNSFKICLNHHHSGGTGIMPVRVWESIGCGVLLLGQRLGAIDEFFTDGEHLVLYDTLDECVAQAKHLLEHPDTLETIAHNGYLYGRAHHTYRNRAQTILETIFQKPTEARPVDAGLRWRAERMILRYRLARLKVKLLSQRRH